MPDALDTSTTRQLTTEIVSAYVRNHSLGATDLPILITSVHNSLNGLLNPATPEPAALVPAVPWKRSITSDYVVCLDCGWRGKTLKRHLAAQHGLTADAYRKRWKLPSDFPMTAINYSRQRSDLAKELGLGRRAGTATAAVALQPEPEAETPPEQDQAAAAPVSEPAGQPAAQPAAQKRNATRKAGSAKKTGGKRTAAKKPVKKPAKATSKAGKTNKRSAAASRRKVAKKETAASAAPT